MRMKLKITEGIFPMPVLMVATYNVNHSMNGKRPKCRTVIIKFLMNGQKKIW